MSDISSACFPQCVCLYCPPAPAPQYFSSARHCAWWPELCLVAGRFPWHPYLGSFGPVCLWWATSPGSSFSCTLEDGHQWVPHMQHHSEFPAMLWAQWTWISALGKKARPWALSLSPRGMAAPCICPSYILKRSTPISQFLVITNNSVHYTFPV